MRCNFSKDNSHSQPQYIGMSCQGIMYSALVLSILITIIPLVKFLSSCQSEIVEAPEVVFTDTDTTPPIIVEVQRQDGKVTAKVTDDHGVESVTLHWKYVIAPYEREGRPQRGWIRPISSGEGVINMVRRGQIYSANFYYTRTQPYSDDTYLQVIESWIEAQDYNGNTAKSR